MAHNKLSIIISENTDCETKCRGVLEFIKRWNQKLEDESALYIYPQLLLAIFGNQNCWMDEAVTNPRVRQYLLELLAPVPNGPLLNALRNVQILPMVSVPLAQLPVSFITCY